MSVEPQVYVFKPGDAKWLEMKARWDEAAASSGEIPDDVLEFFHWTYPGPGMDVGHAWIRASEFPAWVKRYEDPGGDCEGFEVDLTKLPAGATILRFVNER